MAAEVIMPKLGMSMVEGTVIAWKKQVGDPIAKGEGIVDISSEKIEMELEAPADGILIAIAVNDGGVVPYGTVLGYIGESGEQIEHASHAGAESTQDVAAAAVAAEKTEPVSAAVTAENTTPAPAGRKGSNLRVSPVAKKMAEEAGLDLESITGTGPQGRITKEDVEKALAKEAASRAETAPQPQGTSQPAAAPLSSTQPAVEASKTASNQEVVERTAVTGMRKVIATRMLESLQQSAQLTMTAKADLTDLLALQRQLASELEKRQEGKLTVTDLIARAVVLSLKKHRLMNSAYLTDQQEPRIETYGHVHLGIAVALEKGLVVPVIRHADQLSLLELSKAIKSLGEQARNNRLSGDEMKGSTFTISNLGAYGVEHFTPVLNPPEAGILGVGAIEAVPVYRGEELQRRSLLPLSLTFDHRVLDGAPAAQFLGSVKDCLENPLSLLL
ncbi:2-oxo acid dehydrogenase subunit E2 [Brevibacillus borstelensis]|uniref:dihydrolipoamide acetyltransferase family protein n=1 Tax=Brevibacillus borstelensis TaxID=45462 RepID=UPI000F07F301|nr:dihydrolipoamide acetyltransferase family protein [Brevibacillus borstelensis]MED1883121.1 dihydrolipoamide acetyltransferase family protein [Brevibacillus borstelensis]RNB65226.1 2-oxo acid dehydrogenase subunit E2 [Brevibacillus borstelensis]